MSIFEIILKNTGMFFVVYFVFKKASKPLGAEEKSTWLKRLRYIYYINLMVNIYFITIIEIDVYGYEYLDDDTLRGTWNQ